MSQFEYRYGGNMTKFKSVKAIWAVLILIGLSNLFFFQNCSNTGLTAAGIPSVCTDSGNGQLNCTTNLRAIGTVDRDGSSTSAPSSTFFGASTAAPAAPPPTTAVSTTSSTSGISVAAPIASTTPATFIPPIGTQKFNFVAGDRFTCENSIQSRLRLTASCKIGGGCGLSCGVPNGTTCLSANPSAYGTCILAAYGENIIAGSLTDIFSFTGADQASCERNMVKGVGLKASCVIGGACGTGCGVPNGTTCVSDSPGVYGACVKAFFKLPVN